MGNFYDSAPAAKTVTITATGRYYVESAGAVSLQVQSVSSLTFTVELTNHNPGTVFSTVVPYGLNGDRVEGATACTPSAGDYLGVASGTMSYVVINVSAGTGVIESTTAPGLQLY